MNKKQKAIVLLAMLLTGCGGGGGGGGTPPPAGGGGTGGGGTETGGTGGGGTGGGASTGPGSAEILFPWAQSAALSGTVVVRGTASDPDGIAAVRIDVVGSAPAVSAKGFNSTLAISGSAVMTPTDAEIDATDESGDVEWSAEVDLEAGDNEIVVTVEDETGDVTDDADAASVKYSEVPGLFASDIDDTRLLGWSTSPSRFGDVTRFVAFDYGDGTQTVYPEMQDVGHASCFRGLSDELVYLVLGLDGEWEVRSFNVATRGTSLVAEIPAGQLDPGPGFSVGPLLMQLACSGVHDSVYLLANYWEDGDPARSVIFEIDAAGDFFVLTESGPLETPLWSSRRISLSGDSIVSLHDVSPVEPLTLVSLDPATRGDRAELAPAIPVGGLALAAALDQDRVFVTTFDGVDRLRPSVPVKENISPTSPTEPLVFSQADSIAVDLVGNRVIVGDSDLNLLIGVDIDTGERTELLSRKIGSGISLITPRRLALTQDGATLYVLDDGGNASERLFEVDLATGDRRLIGQIHEPGVNRSVTGLALDETAGEIYVSRFEGGTILRVNLETEIATPITSSGDGLLEGITDIILDAVNQRLLVADAVTDAIVAVDIVTLQKELISRDGERGAGPAFTTLTSLTMTPDGVLYAADQATNEIISVDPETGDRTLFETSCGFTTPESLSRVVFIEAANEFLIRADGVFALDLDTSVCLPVATQQYPLDIVVTESGQILAAAFNAVLQIDRQTGDLVIVSR